MKYAPGLRDRVTAPEASQLREEARWSRIVLMDNAVSVNRRR
ncbi:hypothetical protein NG2371_01357 [Nocardia gamkensis]|nr:hypothetical protein [Nocardia gamkensis]